MSEDLAFSDLRAEAIRRLARRIHPQSYPVTLEVMPADVMAESIPPGMVDALLAGRIDVPNFRTMFHALCPPLECGEAGLARVSMALNALGESPALFFRNRLLCDPLYQGQGMVTDRRIWAAAAACPYLETETTLRFEPRELSARAIMLSPQVGMNARQNPPLPPPQEKLSKTQSGIQGLMRTGLDVTMGATRNRARLAMTVAWTLRGLAHGNRAVPTVAETVALRDELLRSPMGFEKQVLANLRGCVACRLISHDQAESAMADIGQAWRELR